MFELTDFCFIKYKNMQRKKYVLQNFAYNFIFEILCKAFMCKSQKWNFWTPLGHLLLYSEGENNWWQCNYCMKISLIRLTRLVPLNLITIITSNKINIFFALIDFKNIITKLWPAIVLVLIMIMILSLYLLGRRELYFTFILVN